MKKAKSTDGGRAAKGNAAPKTVDEYLARVPEPARTTLNKIRATIRSVLPPEATEAISYGVPTFKYKGPVVWFAAFSNHCSLFPTAAVIERFKDELKAYRTSKGTIQFPVDKPLPSALLKKMVKARMAAIEHEDQALSGTVVFSSGVVHGGHFRRRSRRDRRGIRSCTRRRCYVLRRCSARS